MVDLLILLLLELRVGMLVHFCSDGTIQGNQEIDSKDLSWANFDVEGAFIYSFIFEND